MIVFPVRAESYLRQLVNEGAVKGGVSSYRIEVDESYPAEESLHTCARTNYSFITTTSTFRLLTTIPNHQSHLTITAQTHSTHTHVASRLVNARLAASHNSLTSCFQLSLTKVSLNLRALYPSRCFLYYHSYFARTSYTQTPLAYGIYA